MTLTITSAAFPEGAEIPPQYTCQGADFSPPISWSGVPDNAKSLVFILDDPDAPDPARPQRVWVHWVLYNIPPDATGLPEGVTDSNLPTGTENGRNDWDRTGYGGPCPPIGRHRYFHKLYALDTRLTGLKSPTKAEVLSAMEGHVIAEAVVMGTFIKTN